MGRSLDEIEADRQSRKLVDLRERAQKNAKAAANELPASPSIDEIRDALRRMTKMSEQKLGRPMTERDLRMAIAGCCATAELVHAATGGAIGVQEFLGMVAGEATSGHWKLGVVLGADAPKSSPQ